MTEPAIVNWDYTPPPGACDWVIDNPVMRGTRWLACCGFRLSMRHYHRMRVTGLDHVPAREPVIIAANHTSHLDVLAILAALPWRTAGRTCAVAAEDYFFTSAARSVLTRSVVDCIPIDRNGRSARGLHLCAGRLRQGGNVIFFPAGTRSADGGIGPFKAGVVAVSRGCRVPVLPCAVTGTFDSLPRDRLLPRPTPIVLQFGAPVCFAAADFAGLSHEDAALLLETRVREMLR